MTRRFKSRLFWAAIAVVALVGLYAAFGFYAVPRIARSQAISFVRSSYGRDLAIGEVRFNPFLLQLEVKDLALPDADGQTLLGFKRLFIDFEVSSLWNRAYTFREITLESPRVRAIIHPDGRVNLADLEPKAPAKSQPKPEQAGGLPSVWIQAFNLSDGAADFIDQARRPVFERRFPRIAFSLKDFRTTPEGGGFHFSALSQDNEKFDWKGRFALEPGIHSEGDFTIGDLRVPGIGDFLGDARPFTATDGLLNLGGHYEFATGNQLTVKLDLPKIAFSRLSLRAKGADADWVQLPSLEITDTKVALPERTVSVGEVALTGLKAAAWRAADGSLNLMQFLPAAKPASPAAGTPAVPTAPAPATPPATSPAVPAWQVNLAGFDLREASIAFEDRSLDPAAKFNVAPLHVGVKNISLDLGRQLPVTFNLKINGSGSLSGSGSVTPQPLAADIDLALDGFELRDVQPYAAGKTGLLIRSGTVGVKGKVAMRPPNGSEPGLSFAGDVTLAGFGSVDSVLQQDFLNFERLEIAKLRYAMAPDSLSIDRIRIVRPFSRVSISPDQVLNVAAVLDPQGAAKALAERKAAQATQESAPAGKKPRGGSPAPKQLAATPPPAPQPKPAGMPMRIGELRVENGAMDFSDFSVKPNFAARITSLQGGVTDMTSDPKAHAKVDMQGKVGEFSPVTISGELQPFAFDRYTDIGMKFENISLPIFNPYSGKFAGYNIAQGKLTTDLHYHIEARKLDATHHIRIDQLQWGEATAEKGEATLPVKFATSLLKDADGVINLDIPIAGTLDDPTFRIGPIVWQVIKNILSKVVTAPFRALGALFKGAEDAQFVEFAAGQSALDAAAAERLAGLGKALAPKADIRIKVPIGALAELDAPTLAEQRYAAELQSATRKVTLGKKAASDKPAPAFDSLAPDKQVEVLSELVQHVTGAPPAIPPPPAAAEGTSRKEGKAMATAATLEALQKEARARLAPSQAELDQLAQARGEAIQRALLDNTGLDPQRVFLTKTGKVTAEGGKARFELAME